MGCVGRVVLAVPMGWTFSDSVSPRWVPGAWAWCGVDPRGRPMDGQSAAGGSEKEAQRLASGLGRLSPAADRMHLPPALRLESRP